jgi:hypothetical protein
MYVNIKNLKKMLLHHKKYSCTGQNLFRQVRLIDFFKENIHKEAGSSIFSCEKFHEKGGSSNFWYEKLLEKAGSSNFWNKSGLANIFRFAYLPAIPLQVINACDMISR